MTTVYKLTDAAGYTRRGLSGETLWIPGEWVEVEWGGSLCHTGCLHAYTDPLLAALMDPVHAGLGSSARLWIADGNVRATAPDKLGCDRLRILREHESHEVSTAQCARFAILCGLEVYSDAQWIAWARGWLSGDDRSAAAAYAAADAAYPAAAAAAAARAAYYAADAAHYAATAAYYAADAAIDLLALAEQAILEEP